MNITYSTQTKDTDTLFSIFQKKGSTYKSFSSNKTINYYFDQIIATDDHPNLHVIYTPELKGITRIVFIEFIENSTYPLESFRKIGNSIAKTSIKLSHQKIGVDVEKINEWNPYKSVSISSLLSALTEGYLLGLYKFDKYLTDKSKNSKKEVKDVILFGHHSIKEKVQTEIINAKKVCESQIFSRDLINAPSNELYPIELAKRISLSAKKNKYKCRVLKKKDIQTLKMGGLLAVNKGSVHEPVFIISEYKPTKGKFPTVVLIGKGITFDTGGISLKPSAGMGDMISDMAGAAAVAGTMEAVAKLKLPIHVIGLIPSTDNMPSGSAQNPGDIITTMSGLTVEVDNTDAEGRLVLCDALTFAKRFKPDVIIDLATLTGACVVALGSNAAGLMSNSEDLSAKLIRSGNSTYERVWSLPLFDEYDKQIKSHVADIKNVGGRDAGAITAGKFLQRFVDKNQKWAHLDVAGVTYLDSEKDYSPKGGTGFGVRLLIDFLKNYNSK